MPSVGIVILDTSAGHYLDPHFSNVSCDVMELSGNEATVDFLSQFIYNLFQISLQAHSNTNSVVCGDLNTGLQCWPVLGFPLLKCYDVLEQTGNEAATDLTSQFCWSGCFDTNVYSVRLKLNMK